MCSGLKIIYESHTHVQQTQNCLRYEAALIIINESHANCAANYELAAILCIIHHYLWITYTYCAADSELAAIWSMMHHYSRITSNYAPLLMNHDSHTQTVQRTKNWLRNSEWRAHRNWLWCKGLTLPLLLPMMVSSRRMNFRWPCNTLQHTATHCNTLQHTATHLNI